MSRSDDLRRAFEIAVGVANELKSCDESACYGASAVVAAIGVALKRKEAEERGADYHVSYGDPRTVSGQHPCMECGKKCCPKPEQFCITCWRHQVDPSQRRNRTMNVQNPMVCERCGHRWLSWLEHPKKCSRCRSKLYDAPIKNPEQSERMRRWWEAKRTNQTPS